MNGREKMEAAEQAMLAGRAADDLRKRLADGSLEAREEVKRAAFACMGLYPAHGALFADVVAEVDRLNGTGPASAADVARLGELVEKQGADFAAEAQRLEDGKRQAEEKPMEVGMEVVEMMLDGLDLQQRGLFLAMRNAHGNQTHAAREMKVSQSKVNKALPALRDAIRATGRELPEFLLPPAKRKRIPDAPRKLAFVNGGVEAADTRTPFDEAAEREESEHGAE